jgi:hypothetical protein
VASSVSLTFTLDRHPTGQKSVGYRGGWENGESNSAGPLREQPSRLRNLMAWH